MPYLTGGSICSIANLFGLPLQNSGTSRWIYFDQLLEHCLRENLVSDLLKYLFEKKQFSKVLEKHSINEINAAHSYIISAVISEINGVLFFSGNELVLVNGEYMVRKIGSKIEVQTPEIKTIDREYIKSISSRAMDDVDQKNFDSAITKARTLLEETFFYVIEKKGEIPSDSGDIAKLFKQVKDLYHMHTDRNTDRRINTLLSGLNNIVSAIAEMRNKDSDAHGVGSNRIAIDEHHARLFVNSSMTMADFILSVACKQNNSDKH